jgi:hypothetical protein
MLERGAHMLGDHPMHFPSVFTAQRLITPGGVRGLAKLGMLSPRHILVCRRMSRWDFAHPVLQFRSIVFVQPIS